MDFMLSLMSNDIVHNWATGFAQSEVIKMTVAFLIAARLHRKWVKKDMGEQFSEVTKAINNVAEAYRNDMALQNRRVDDLSNRVIVLERRSQS